MIQDDTRESGFAAGDCHPQAGLLVWMSPDYVHLYCRGCLRHVGTVGRRLITADDCTKLDARRDEIFRLAVVAAMTPETAEPIEAPEPAPVARVYCKECAHFFRRGRERKPGLPCPRKNCAGVLFDMERAS